MRPPPAAMPRPRPEPTHDGPGPGDARTAGAVRPAGPALHVVPDRRGVPRRRDRRPPTSTRLAQADAQRDRAAVRLHAPAVLPGALRLSAAATSSSRSTATPPRRISTTSIARSTCWPSHLPARRLGVAVALGRRHAHLLPGRAARAHLRALRHDTSQLDARRRGRHRDRSARHLARTADARCGGWGSTAVSMGVQDFAPDVQQAVNRVQSYEQTLALVDHARALGLHVGQHRSHLRPALPDGRGLPAHARAGADDSARPPGRVLVRLRAVDEGAHEAHPGGRRCRGAGEARAARPWRSGASGARATARSAWTTSRCPRTSSARAVEGRVLQRNFMGYTVQSARDMVALGVSGIGDVQSAFVQNYKKLPDYYAALDQGRFPIERGYVLDGGRRDPPPRDHRADVQRPPGHPRRRGAVRRWRSPVLRDELADADRPRVARGRWSRRGQPQALDVTPLGRMFVRNICMTFDQYLRARTGGRLPSSAARYDDAPRRGRGRRYQRAHAGVHPAGRRPAPGAPLSLTVVEAAPRAGGHVAPPCRRLPGRVGPQWVPQPRAAHTGAGRCPRLQSRLVEARPRAAGATSCAAGRCASARRPVSLLTSPALSWSGKLRLLGEPFAGRALGPRGTVYDFASRRIGSEAAEMLVDAAVGRHLGGRQPAAVGGRAVSADGGDGARARQPDLGHARAPASRRPRRRVC